MNTDDLDAPDEVDELDLAEENVAAGQWSRDDAETAVDRLFADWEDELGEGIERRRELNKAKR